MLGVEPFFPAFANKLKIVLDAASPFLELRHVQVEKAISTKLALQATGFVLQDGMQVQLKDRARLFTTNVDLAFEREAFIIALRS